MGLKDRLIKFIKYKSLNKSEFERLVGLSNGFVDKSGDNIRYTTLNKISKTFPDLNTSWLGTGEGEMINKGYSYGFYNEKTKSILESDANAENEQLKTRILELEKELNELKNDKAILRDYIAVLKKNN